MLAVAEFKTLDELANIRMTWKQLWEQTPDATYFQSYEWFRSHHRYYGEGTKLKVLLVSMAGKPVGIVPLIVRNERTQLGVASVLTFPLGSWGSFYGQIGPNAVATYQGALAHLFRHRQDWNVMELPNCESSESQLRLHDAFQKCGLQSTLSGALRHPKISLHADWDEYLTQLPVALRMRLSHSEHALSRRGPISFHRWRPQGSSSGMTSRRWDLLQHVEHLKRKSDSCSSRADIELSFLRDAHPGAVDQGCIDICTLSVGRRPIAASYSYVAHGTIQPVLVVAEPELSECASDLLLSQMIRDGFLRGDDQLVFRTEHQDLIAPWANDASLALTFGYYAWLSPQAQMLRLKQKRRGKQLASHGAIPMSGIADTSVSVRLFAPS